MLALPINVSASPQRGARWINTHDGARGVESNHAAAHPLLAAHDDERGVFVFPEKALPEGATTMEALVEEIGELGEWIELAAPGLPEEATFQALGAGQIAQCRDTISGVSWLDFVMYAPGAAK